jgi:hypothetical protein
MRKKFTFKEANRRLEGVQFLNRDFRVILAKAFSRLPGEVADWAFRRLLFFSDRDGSKAFFLTKEGWGRKKGFIFLSNVLMEESEEELVFIVAHEIAHAKLNHRSCLLNPRMAEKDMDRQEIEADALADKWLGLV